MGRVDEDLLAELAGEYYDWCLGKGGTPPRVLLAKPLTPPERETLLEEMKLIDRLHALTSLDRSRPRH